MDIYDHIQEENYKETEKEEKDGAEPKSPGLNEELQETIQAISNSPWAAKLGGFWQTAKKQGATYLEEAKREYTVASSEASKGFSEASKQASKGFSEASKQASKGFTEASKGINDFVTRARALSIEHDPDAPPSFLSGDGSFFTLDELPRSSTDTTATVRPSEAQEKPESLPADIVKEAEALLTRFRGEASKRLKDIQKAEDAADEALLKFGTNIRNFLRDAVVVTAPAEASDGGSSKVLFESKDADGKRVIHTTRFDAQLHVIHSSADSFLHDPKSEQYEPWAKDFDIDKRTDEIAKDLDKYEELRRAMEKCVPEKVEYKTFWTRYYFLRHVIETEEARRRELLKGAASTEEEVAWDEESDSEESATPKDPRTSSTTTLTKATANTTETTKPSGDLLKPGESRKSEDKQSQAGSESSYDIVSGAASRTLGSPIEEKTQAEAEAVKSKDKAKGTESDDDDWE